MRSLQNSASGQLETPDVNGVHRDSRKRMAMRHALWMAALVSLGACSNNSDSGSSSSSSSSSSGPTLNVKLTVGSALGDVCKKALDQFNQKRVALKDGTVVQGSCDSVGSGDLVNKMRSLADQLKSGTLKADAEDFPTLFALDGDIYLSQLVFEMDQRFPGQNYIPTATDSPLVATSPMVFMAQEDLAEGVSKVPDVFKMLGTATDHRALDPNAPAIPVTYVHTAPTRSNSGLQTLVAQFASVSGKRPEELTLDDVKANESNVAAIQSKVTRYGSSTNGLAKSMVSNGAFWASIGSVYESSVIVANSNLNPGQKKFRAIYPPATFSSNMRLVTANGPWISGPEKEAAKLITDYLVSPEAQTVVTELGLRPGSPGVPLGSKFSADFGVQAQPQYDSYRPPKPEVVEAMLKAWQDNAKKPSQVVLVVDSSGSMEGDKLPAVQNTLQTYLSRVGPKEKVALIDFDSDVREAVVLEGPADVPSKGMQFIAGLKADGQTHLYDAALAARNWLQANYRKGAINAVLILTDGDDSGSSISLDQLGEELKKTGFGTDLRIAYFTVGYGTEGEFNPDALKKIAELNGGYYRKGDSQTIGSLMMDLQTEF